MPLYNHSKPNNYKLYMTIFETQIVFNKPLALRITSNKISFLVKEKCFFIYADQDGIAIDYNRTSYQYSIRKTLLARAILSRYNAELWIKTEAVEFQKGKFRLTIISKL